MINLIIEGFVPVKFLIERTLLSISNRELGVLEVQYLVGYRPSYR